VIFLGNIRIVISVVLSIDRQIVYNVNIINNFIIYRL